jgi:DNA replication protein DnaC
MHDPKVKPSQCSTSGCGNEVEVFVINGEEVYAPMCAECVERINAEGTERFWRETQRISNYERWGAMGIPKRFWDEDFTTFVINDYNRIAYDACLTYAVSYSPETTSGGVVLLGSIASGKTHLVCSILKAAGEGMLINQRDLVTDMRYEFARDTERHKGLREAAMATPLLVLDDLGSDEPTEAQAAWIRDVLYQIANARWGACLPTIITANATMKQFDKRLGGRVVSRLAGGSQILSIDDPIDHRTGKPR